MQSDFRDLVHGVNLMVGGRPEEGSQVLPMPCLRSVLGEQWHHFHTACLFSFSLSLFYSFPRAKVQYVRPSDTYNEE